MKLPNSIAWKLRQMMYTYKKVERRKKLLYLDEMECFLESIFCPKSGKRFDLFKR